MDKLNVCKNVKKEFNAFITPPKKKLFTKLTEDERKKLEDSKEDGIEIRGKLITAKNILNNGSNKIPEYEALIDEISHVISKKDETINEIKEHLNKS